MFLKAFSAREAADVGTALADDLVLQSASGTTSRLNVGRAEVHGKELQKFLQKFLQRVDRAARPLQLNVFKRAKLANSFKWRVLERGVDRGIVDELTQALVMRLSAPAPSAAQSPESARGAADDIESLLVKADAFVARGEFAQAMECYADAVKVDPRHAVSHNNLGAALVKLGRYKEAEGEFRRAIGIREGYPEAHGNLGSVLRALGRPTEAETQLRRALKLKPAYVDALSSLGLTLVLLARLREARECFEKVLRVAPRHAEALSGQAQLAGIEGRFDEAEAAYRRALEVDPRTAAAWAALAHLRRMTPADRAWLRSAEDIAERGLGVLDEANVRYAIGKYYDDVGDYPRAFRNFQRANELQKGVARPYDREAHARYVDDLIRAYTRENLAGARAGASDSTRPVFVVGMPRSGTSLIEQIIAAHPAAYGAGELTYWAYAVRRHEHTLRQAPPGEALTRKLAAGYLKVIEQHSADAPRVVNKTPYNADRLGIIHAVLPKARSIYVRRDPIDTCLSCYFQQLLPSQEFAMDLADLAHYYRQHHRLLEHWRRVLPAGTLLEVPYAGLIADQEKWSRKIIDFLGLEWDERCLDFHRIPRPVVTASYWQVRQKIYKTSVGRWRNYQKFIAPLLELKDLSA